MKPVDVARQIGAVTREVESRMHEGAMARVVVASRSYATTIADLWEAITSAERIPRWFMPITGELRLGGRYQLQGNAGGTITTCEPPKYLAVTWEFGGGMSWVTVRLSPDPKGGTRLELGHIAHLGDDLWDQYGPGAAGVGWDLAILGLGLHVETGAIVDPKDAEAWSISAEGQRYIGLSSEDWCRASIAAGTDAPAAKAAAARTTAFYTGGDVHPGGG